MPVWPCRTWPIPAHPDAAQAHCIQRIGLYLLQLDLQSPLIFSLSGDNTRAVVLNWGNVPWETLGNVWRHFWCHSWAENAAKQLECTGQPPTAEVFGPQGQQC